MILPMRIEKELRDFIHRQYPDMSNEADMRLTYNIYGSYYTYQRHCKTADMKDIIEIVSKAQI